MQVRRTWMDHEGGTKFYQAFLITAHDGRALTVIHHGPIGGHDRGFRPVLGGQIVIHDGADKYAAQIAAKQKRGYTVVTALQTETKYRSVAELNNILVAQFGASRTQEILLRLGYTLDAKGAPDEPDDEPSVELEDTPIETVFDPSTKPESWGSW